MANHITDYFIYRWRYAISYTLIGIIVGGFLIAAALYAPGGLSKAEMTSTVASNNLSLRSFEPSMAINFPYALLQKVSFFAFGITTLSIKLPSILLGLATALGVIMLFRSWFHKNVAIIASLIALTSSQFIFNTQNGTSAIMYLLLPTWLLLSAMMVSRQLGKRSFWEFLLMATVALSLYTPLSIYIIVALLSATILHPHLRFIVGRVSKQKLIIATLSALILLAPLLTALAIDPAIGLDLLGVPDAPPDYKANAIKLVGDYFSFLSPSSDEYIRPIYTLTSVLFVLLGLTRLLTTKYTARSYVITSWTLLLAPVLLLNPDTPMISFLPIMLLIAMGAEVLLSRWYRLFPRNPYARVVGLIPITLLIAGMTLGGVERYIYGYHYNPAVVNNFSNDLTLVKEQLESRETAPVTIVVDESEKLFYQAVASHESGVTVLEPDQPVPGGLFTIATRNAFHARDMAEPTMIITSGRFNEGDRLYLYKTTP